MKIAIAGKGGSGKTSIAGTLARLLARRGLRGLVAIDGDSNPNLALTLGIGRERLDSVKTMPRNVLERVENGDGTARLVLADSPDTLIERYGNPAPDGVTLVLMSMVSHAGAG